MAKGTNIHWGGPYGVPSQGVEFVSSPDNDTVPSPLSLHMFFPLGPYRKKTSTNKKLNKRHKREIKKIKKIARGNKQAENGERGRERMKENRVSSL